MGKEHYICASKTGYSFGNYLNAGGAIAQSVEQRTENPCVPGSNPGGTTSKSLSEMIGFFDEKNLRDGEIKIKRVVAFEKKNTTFAFLNEWCHSSVGRAKD